MSKVCHTQKEYTEAIKNGNPSEIVIFDEAGLLKKEDYDKPLREQLELIKERRWGR